jgi:Flp pilus assembly protein CpaB
MAQTVAPRPRTPPPDANGLPLAPAPRRRRKWSLALVGTLVTVGCALAFAVLWMNAGDRQPVLAVAKAVPAGQVIESSDLRVIRVSTDPGLKPLRGDQLDRVVGLRAATDLVPGTLLTNDNVGQGDGLQAGEAVVGVALKPGQFPSGLEPGDHVEIVRTTPPASSASDEGIGSLGTVLDEARVLDVVQEDVTSGTRVVSLVVDEEVAAEVAGAASAELVSLVLVPAGR